MWNLYSPPPETVDVEGKAYKINTDFRVWTEIEKLLCSNSTSFPERMARCFALAFVELPPSPIGALEAMLDFYDPSDKCGKAHTSASFSAPLYDTELDSAYIYGSFLSQYGIDLTRERLHWWKFRALLSCLDDDSKFSRVVAYRSADIHSISDPSTRRFAEKMKRLYALPDPRSDEEREMAQNQCMESLF